MISYVPEKNSAENTEAMLQAIEHVKTGQITYAVRDTRIDDKEIHEGDMMGIGDHGSWLLARTAWKLPRRQLPRWWMMSLR